MFLLVSSRIRLRVVALACITTWAATVLIVACSKKHEEPESRPGAHAPSSAWAMDAGKEDGRVLKQWNTKLPHESCEDAAKHANLVFGRGETDPKGTVLLSRCLQLGNLAWYSCVMEANAPAQISACSNRYLGPPPE
ncbi:MAG: hypothetical protein HY898_26145 [Deltaproteobacteria bacterium]|nr:hypothetical protein [Deltaproteobacteria bacterium]